MSTSAPAVHLLDGNVLVALADAGHVHHLPARRWFVGTRAPFATCPITQGTLLRMLLRGAAVPTIEAAAEVLGGFVAHPRHHFWPDAVSYLEITWRGVLGHAQVSDAYLAALTRQRKGKLATFDGGLAALHPDVAVLIED